MIFAYLTLSMAIFGSHGQWPERQMQRFDTEAACWAAIDGFMKDVHSDGRNGPGMLSFSWRCGSDT